MTISGFSGCRVHSSLPATVNATGLQGCKTPADRGGNENTARINALTGGWTSLAVAKTIIDQRYSRVFCGATLGREWQEQPV
jgi:hypothetical protein